MASQKHAIIFREANVYLFTPSDVVSVIRNAPTLQDAIAALQQAASPDTIKGVFNVNRAGFQACRRVIEALQKAGYTSVESIESSGYYLSSVIHNLPMDQTIGTVIFVVNRINSQVESFLSAATVLEKYKSGWKLIERNPNVIAAFEEYFSVSDVVLYGGTPDDEITMITCLPGAEVHVREAQPEVSFAQYRIVNGKHSEDEILPCFGYDLLVEFGDKSDTISLVGHAPPFTITKKVDVGDASSVEIRARERGQSEHPVIKTFALKSVASKTVSITVHVDKTLLPQVSLKAVTPCESSATTVASQFAHFLKTGKSELWLTKVLEDLTKSMIAEGVESTPNLPKSLPTVSSVVNVESSLPTRKTSKAKKSGAQRRKQARLNAAQNGTANKLSKPADVPTISTLPNDLSQLELNPTPTTILTFTTDNRVLIKADATYTGNQFILAYVWLQSGKPPQVGKNALDALLTYPDSVFYDITRLLNTDFDPTHPDLSWRFKTSRDADGKVLIHGGDDLVTLPIVLFGLVVKSTLLYIQEHRRAEVDVAGIRLPRSSFISDNDLKTVSEKIGTKLVIVEDD